VGGDVLSREFWRLHGKPLLLGGALLLALLGAKDVMILARSPWPHLTGVVNTSTLNWEEIACYMPFANRASPSTPFPSRPFPAPGDSRFSNFPFITIWTEAFVFKVLCLGNADAFLLAGHAAFPLLSFLFLYAVFAKFIEHRKWILFFAFMGVCTYSRFSHGDYALGLISKGAGAALDLASFSPYEITRIPSPAISFFIFIFCFYLTIAERRLSPRRIVFLSAAWGLNVYVYLFNFIIGAAFWILYAAYSRRIADKKWDLSSQAKTFAIIAAVLALCLSPVAINNLFFSDEASRQMIEKMGVVTKLDGSAFDWGRFFLTAVLPGAGAALLIRAFALDSYELFFRFTPVFIVALIEALVLNINVLFGKFLQPHLFNIRIGAFFFHYFYLVPFIYYVGHPPKVFFHGGWDSRLVTRASRFLRLIVIERAGFVLFPAMLFVAVQGALSNVKIFRHQAERTAAAMPVVEARLDLLTEGARAGDTLVSESMPVNMLVPALTPQATLVVNAFNNYETTRNIVDRLALYARIYDWDYPRFEKFMMPADWIKSIYKDPLFEFTDEVYGDGFGYWLTFHHKQMAEADKPAYAASLKAAYDGVDLKRDLARFNVRRVEKAAGAPALPLGKRIEKGIYALYIMEETN
jgi:hypothetical protein